jgi:methionyl-tRNA formyltransferase
MENKKIVLLATDGFSTNVLYNLLHQNALIDTVILENKIDKKSLIKRRIKKLGLIKTAGQLIFQAVAVPLLDVFSGKRKAALKRQFNLDSTHVPLSKIKRVSSVNSDAAIQLLRQINPDLVIINGTRIISKKTLESVKCKFINTHAGITPKYRGVHGAYWALVNNDKENCGVTVHLVDAGIDTGGILYQSNIAVSKKDNFSTYPVLQLAAGMPLLLKAIRDNLENKLALKESGNESHLWHHPAIWEYIYNRLVKKIK